MLWLLALPAAVLLVWTIYPGELSWLPGKGQRWLYDRAAARYPQKWQRHNYRPYDELITRAAAEVVACKSHARVADLACGSGRAMAVAAARLGPAAHYQAVDFSPAMLQQFRQRIAETPQLQACDIELYCEDLSTWLAEAGRFDLLLLLEAAEFVPAGRGLIPALGRATVSGGLLVMTRPAGVWSKLFPGRGQGRQAMEQALAEAGFGELEFIAWRRRYELVLARKT